MLRGDEVNAEFFKTSPACHKMVEAGEIDDFDNLQLYFFKKYMKIVTDANNEFNIDGWEEVWEYEKKG